VSFKINYNRTLGKTSQNHGPHCKEKMKGLDGIIVEREMD